MLVERARIDDLLAVFNRRRRMRWFACIGPDRRVHVVWAGAGGHRGSMTFGALESDETEADYAPCRRKHKTESGRAACRPCRRAGKFDVAWPTTEAALEIILRARSKFAWAKES